MPTDRYFIDENDAKTGRMKGQPGAGHIEIAAAVLPGHGIRPANDTDHYVQMFRFKYVCVVENDDGTVEVEHGPALTTAQKHAVRELKARGKRVTVTKSARG